MQLNVIKSAERLARADNSIISLGQGIPSLPVDKRIHDAVMSAMSAGKTDSYSDPQGMLELRVKIATRLKQEGMHYDAAEIIVTAGAVEALNLALRHVTSRAKSEIIIPTPVYSAYFQLITAAGGTAVDVPLNEKAGWTLDIAQIVQSITDKTAAIMLCNPNNPTGSIYDRQTLDAICELAMQRGIMVIIDEVYRNMVYDDDHLYSPTMTAKYRRNVIRVMSFSKDFSLTGWRVGYLHTDKIHVASMLALHDTLVNCAPVVAQYAAMAALNHYDEIVERNRVIYRRQRDIMMRELRTVSGMLDICLPRAGYFFFPRYKSLQSSASLANELAQKANLIVIPGGSFGRGGEGHLRLCFGRSEEAITTGINYLRQYFEGEK
jgi:aminotransferase